MEYYKPAEDTYIFTKELLRELENRQNLVICEIGVGSGYISKKLSAGRKNNFYFGVDINRKVPNGGNLFSLFTGDLLRNIRQDRINIIFFNPPYVETEECNFTDIRASYSGGIDGIEIIERFIKEVTVNELFLLIIEENKPEFILELLRKKYKNVRIVKRQRIRGEVILIIKATEFYLHTNKQYFKNSI